LKSGETLFFSADKHKKSCEILGLLRQKLAKDLMNLINEKKFCFVWVVDFPLFEFSEEEQRIVSMHHPFTSPKEDKLDIFYKENLIYRRTFKDTFSCI
jgi:aspartyl-tRNA synthetase